MPAATSCTAFRGCGLPGLARAGRTFPRKTKITTRMRQLNAQLIGASAQLRELMEEIERVSSSDAKVLPPPVDW